jgi:WD40 repeat protein
VCVARVCGKFMSCVGDSEYLSLFSLSGGSYERVDRLRITPSDHSFCTSWSPSSTQVAAASQAGEVVVWDVRNTKSELARLMAKQRGRHRSLGACRTVKFCPGVTGLMAFAEHENFVHIVDTRTNFSVSQLIRLSPSIHSQSISGLSFSPSSDKLFVGTRLSVFFCPSDGVFVLRGVHCMRYIPVVLLLFAVCCV